MPETATAQSLNEQYGVPQILRFEESPEGLARAIVTCDAATGVLYLQGAHLTEYQPTGQRPVLFTSEQSEFRAGRPIRGGVPICFPWFGPNQSNPDAPMHGLARIKAWDVASVDTIDPSHVRITLTTRIEAFDLTYQVTIGPELDLRLRVHNVSDAAVRYEQALHTYFAISQIRTVEIDGLEGATALDKLKEFNRTQQGADPIRFESETDRVYINHPGSSVLRDPAWGRRIVIEKQNANSTVVWNPWSEKAARLPDLGDEEWPGFVCIESGNIADNAVMLQPDEAHEMATTIRVADQ